MSTRSKFGLAGPRAAAWPDAWGPWSIRPHPSATRRRGAAVDWPELAGGEANGSETGTFGFVSPSRIGLGRWRGLRWSLARAAMRAAAQRRWVQAAVVISPAPAKEVASDWAHRLQGARVVTCGLKLGSSKAAVGTATCRAAQRPEHGDGDPCSDESVAVASNSTSG
jgi:hypothetical protein